jgi:uncharacterized protein YjbJ (UPF0337 family)
MTDQTELKENWPKIKARLRQKYGILTESDLVWVDGKHEQLLGRLNIILGVPKEELQQFIQES